MVCPRVTYSLNFNLSLFRSLISDQVRDCSLFHWSVGLLFMHGSRIFFQGGGGGGGGGGWGSNFENVFCCCLFLVDEGRFCLI